MTNIITDDGPKGNALRAFLSANYAEAIQIASITRIGGSYGGAVPPNYLAKLAIVRPQILSGIPKQLLEELRNEAALEGLFGYEDRRKWEAEEKGYVPFERQFSKNMLRFAANHLVALEQFRRVGIKRVEIRCAGMDWPTKAHEYTCLACRPLHKIVIAIDAVPELPDPKCIGYYGCRCAPFAIFEP